MCGICYTYTPSSSPKSRKIAKQIFTGLLVGNESRGLDSTGVLAVHTKSKRTAIFKDTIPSSLFVDRAEYAKLAGNLYIGHTRQATTGKVSKRNAHPLYFDNMYMVHNGIISNHADLAEKHGVQFEVDSEVVMPAIKSRNYSQLEKTEGSLNFIAYDKDTNELLTLKKGNPLYYVHLKEHDIYAVSSQGDFLSAVCSIYGRVKLLEYTDQLLYIVDLNTQHETSKPLHFIVPPLPIYRKGEKTGYEKAGYRTESDDPYNYGRGYEDDSYSRHTPSIVFAKDTCAFCHRDMYADELAISMELEGMALCEDCLDNYQHAEEQYGVSKMLAEAAK